MVKKRIRGNPRESAVQDIQDIPIKSLPLCCFSHKSYRYSQLLHIFVPIFPNTGLPLTEIPNVSGNGEARPGGARDCKRDFREIVKHITKEIVNETIKKQLWIPSELSRTNRQNPHFPDPAIQLTSHNRHGQEKSCAFPCRPFRREWGFRPRRSGKADCVRFRPFRRQILEIQDLSTRNGGRTVILIIGFPPKNNP